MADPIYTKAGDGGRTRLPGGEMVWKSHPIVSVLGELDALNVEVGGALETLKAEHNKVWKKANRSDTDRNYAIRMASENGRSFTHYDYSEGGYWIGTQKIDYNSEGYFYALLHELFRTQGKLLALGAEVACYETENSPDLKGPVCEEDVRRLEYLIDRATEHDCGDHPHIQPLTGFLIPGGPSGSIALHRARTQCRRVEREMSALLVEMIKPDELHQKYLNRLGDFLFTAARFYHAYKRNGGEELWVDAPDEEVTTEMCRTYEPKPSDDDGY